MDDDELARAVREGLTRRAEQAEPDPAVVGRARAAASRRRARFAVLGAAAAAVALVVGTVVVVTTTRTGDDDAPAGLADSAAPTVTAATDGGNSEPTAWRTEYWRGVQVDVPADWGYGNPGDCGDIPAEQPYVGRPIGITDACVSYQPFAGRPSYPYVWFDVEGVTPGVIDFGGGWSAVTVEVAGSRVSVATDDPELRDRILGSVRRGTLCEASLGGVPRPRFESTREGAGPYVGGRLCAYDHGELVYGVAVDAGLFERTAREVEAAPESSRPCENPASEVVVVTGTFEDPYSGAADLYLDRDVVYDLTCGVASAAGIGLQGGPHRITESTVPWATAQFRRLLTGPLQVGNWVYSRFIGVQG